MKSSIQSILVTVTAMISVNLLIGCAPKRHSGGPRFQRSPDPGTGPHSPVPHGGQNSSPPTANGTSDSGGGTGIDGKVFESYIVDPTQLPAYKQYLDPLLKNIKNETANGPHYEQFFKTKTWYIAPVDLHKVNKEVLGISFLKSDTQQIARQTMNEVWIDKRIFDQMNANDQSDLLLHEFIMNMYLLKFMSVAELCNSSRTLNGDKGSDGCGKRNRALLEKMMPHEKAHPLTDQDNENIRFVTGWLKQNAQKEINQRDFFRVLVYKGFDQRFFTPESENPTSPKDLKISVKEFYQAIRGTELTGNMPKFCFSGSSQAKRPCKVEIKEKKIPLANTQISGLNLRLSVENEPPVNLDHISGDEIMLSAYPQEDDGSIIYVYPLHDWRNKIQNGDRIYSGFLIFKKESSTSQSVLILESVVLRPGIVVSIDKKRDPICQVQTPRAVEFLDDVISIKTENTMPGLIQHLISETPPFAACGANNVVD